MYCSVLYNKLKNMQNVVMKGEKMYKLKKKVTIILAIVILLITTVTVNATDVNTSKNANNTISNNIISNNTITNNQLPKEESAASTLVDIKEGQLKTIDDYKAKYGSDTYGMVAYILHLVQVYSIPIGLVGIAFCAIFEYVIGMKRLDIRDKGFNSMIAAVTIIIICQILPLIFAVVVKSTD